MVQFVEEQRAWRTAGAPRRAIPDDIKDWMDETYANGTVCELPAPSAEDRPEFINMLKLHAKHRELTVYTQDFRRDGEAWIRFKMRDKRPYRRSTIPREMR